MKFQKLNQSSISLRVSCALYEEGSRILFAVSRFRFSMSVQNSTQCRLDQIYDTYEDVRSLSDYLSSCGWFGSLFTQIVGGLMEYHHARS